MAIMMPKPTPKGKMKVNPLLSSTLLLSEALVGTSCATGQREKTVVMLTTGAARNVTRMSQTPQDETNPSVSPDGKTVAFQVRKDNQYDIWTMDSATGRNVIQATSHPMQDIHPAWMQDSKTLVFASDRLGTGIFG